MLCSYIVYKKMAYLHIATPILTDLTDFHDTFGNFIVLLEWLVVRHFSIFSYKLLVNEPSTLQNVVCAAKSARAPRTVVSSR